MDKLSRVNTYKSEHVVAGFDCNKIKKYWKDVKPAHIINKTELTTPFTDGYFPPNVYSLMSRNSDGSYIDEEDGPENEADINEREIEWKRASQIMTDITVFQDLIEFDDIKQGNIGNCYFLSSISAITEFPFLIFEKFRTKVYNPFGYYEVVLFIDGEWQVVFVDDYFPVYKGTKRFAFAKPNGRELWCILLEKAWAKVNGGYLNTIAGIVSEPLYALTGFSTETVLHSEYKLKDLWEKINLADNRELIMCCATKHDSTIEQLGLVEGHAYTLIGAQEYDDGAQNLKLLKVRNPWGQMEWNGDWSDNSKLWTNQLKRVFGHVNRNEGTFFISLEDYVKYFNSTHICHIMYGSLNKYYTFEFEKYFQHPAVFNFYIEEDSKISLSVIFRHWRFNRKLKNPNRPFNLLIAGYNTERDIISLEGEFTAKENIEFIRDLKKGFYLVWLYCPYQEYKADKPFKYTFRVASTSPFKSKFVGLDNEYNLIQKLIVENTKVTETKAIDSSKSFYVGCDNSLRKAGISSLVIINKDKDWLEVKLTATQLYNVKLLPPYEGMQSIELKIPPFQGAAVTGTRLSYSYVDYNFKIRTSSFKCTQDYVTYSVKTENFFSLHLEDYDNTMSFGYNVISSHKAKEVPDFEQLKEITENEISLEQLKGDHQAIMKCLMELPPHPEESNSKTLLKWSKNVLEEGIFIGQINKQGRFHGRGAFIWNKEELDYYEDEGEDNPPEALQKTYLGYWTDGKMDIRGRIFTSNYTTVFEGEYKQGLRSGLGKLFLENEDWYEGMFENNMMNGNGIYHFSNGNIWEGNFRDNKKHGKGLMKFYYDKRIEIIEYEDDNIIKYTSLERKDTKSLAEQIQEKDNKPIRERINYLSKIGESVLKILDEMSEENAIEVKPLDVAVEDTEEEKKRKAKEEKCEELKLIDKFMFDMMMELEQKDEDELLEYKKYENGYYIGAMKDGYRHGRGAYYWRDNQVAYHVGYWEMNKAHGFGRRFNPNKLLIYEGGFEGDFYQGKGKLYYMNGDLYKGNFENHKKQGKGTYTWFNAGKWEGNFNEDKLHGEGKFYYHNSPFTEMMVYNNGSIVNRFDYVNEDELLERHRNKIEELKKKFPDVMRKILILAPTKDNIDLEWQYLHYESGSFYVGQLDKEGKRHGRGCFYWPGNFIAFYVGYWVDNDMQGRGFYYNNISLGYERLIYVGEFKKNLKHGRGRYYYNDGDVYDGYYKDNKKSGPGIYSWKNAGRWEGNFTEDLLEGTGLYIYPDNRTTEIFEYCQSNIIGRKNCVDNQDKEEILRRMKDLQKLETYYTQYIDKILALEPTPDDAILNWVKKDCREGYYIGQVNSLDNKHGRGMMYYTYTNEFFIGYWQNGVKEGQGTHYFTHDKIFYIGDHNFDKRVGFGTYYYRNSNDYFTGFFDELGNGKGKYYWENGFWEGPIYNFKLHGAGNYFTREGQFQGVKVYRYHKLVE